MSTEFQITADFETIIAPHLDLLDFYIFHSIPVTHTWYCAKPAYFIILHFRWWCDRYLLNYNGNYANGPFLYAK